MKLYELFKFTFHNVSINTVLAALFDAAENEFTFHNVSINTFSRKCYFDVSPCIYIPQCFY